MQPFLLPDYLDRTKETKDPNLKTLIMCCELVKFIKATKATEMLIEFPSTVEPIVEGINLKKILPLVNQDESMKVFLRAYRGYRYKPHKNFIIHKNLVQALASTKLDIKSKYLPKEFTAFFELKGLKDNDGDTVKGVFVDITQEEEWMLYLGIINYSENPNHFSVSHLNIPLDDTDRPIAEIIKRYEHVYSTVRPEILEKYKRGEKIEDFDGLYKVIFEGGYHNYIHAILNAILYVHHSPEICIEQENIFSTKKSKLEAQKKIFTSRKFIELGQRFSFPRDFTCGEVGVSGHFRWQPHGPNWSLIKHIYIKPHTRNYSKSGELQGDSDCLPM